MIQPMRAVYSAACQTVKAQGDSSRAPSSCSTGMLFGRREETGAKRLLTGEGGLAWGAVAAEVQVVRFSREFGVITLLPGNVEVS